MSMHRPENRKRIKIAVLDSGIDTGVSDLGVFVKAITGFKVDGNGYIVEDKSLVPRHIHGTAVALIIRHLCTQAEFISVNLLDERLSTDGRVLLCALEEVLKLKPDIIHLSLGTTRWRYILPLRSIVKKAGKQDTIIVSAANNQGIKCYPACLRGVVGVKGTPAGSEEYGYAHGFYYAPFEVKGIPGIEELAGGDHLAGTSFSAAYITGRLAAVMTGTDTACNREAVRQLLKRHTCAFK